jgi:hypothetical protein
MTPRSTRDGSPEKPSTSASICGVNWCAAPRYRLKRACMPLLAYICCARFKRAMGTAAKAAHDQRRTGFREAIAKRHRIVLGAVSEKDIQRTRASSDTSGERP